MHTYCLCCDNIYVIIFPLQNAGGSLKDSNKSQKKNVNVKNMRKVSDFFKAVDKSKTTWLVPFLTQSHHYRKLKLHSFL